MVRLWIGIIPGEVVCRFSPSSSPSEGCHNTLMPKSVTRSRALGSSALRNDIVFPEQAPIESVEIRVTSAAARYPGCDNAGPIKNKLAGQLSIQFSVGSILTAGGIYATNWDRFCDPQVIDVTGRSRAVVDNALTNAFGLRTGTSLIFVCATARNCEPIRTISAQ